MPECKKQSLGRYEVEYLSSLIGQNTGEEDGQYMMTDESCPVAGCAYSAAYFYRVEQGRISKIWKEEISGCLREGGSAGSGHAR